MVDVLYSGLIRENTGRWGGGDKKGGGACRKISPGFPQGPPCTSTLAYEQAHASIGAQARAA